MPSFPMRCCCIIKPSAIERASAILRAFARERVLILESQWVRLTPSVLRTLYDHMDREAQDAIIKRYGGKTALALLLSVASLDALLDVVGRESDPAACAPGTLRNRFGRHAPAARVGDWAWWENAIHRPVDERERVRDLDLIFPTSSGQYRSINAHCG